jgi:hypothetical protein
VRILTALVLLIISGIVVGCAQDRLRFNSDSAVEAAIRAGELGPDFAERAGRTQTLYVRKIEGPGVPYDFYTFSDYRGGYTLIVDNRKLILICAGLGGGAAHDFIIERRNADKILKFKYEMGSGISRTIQGEYTLGSGLNSR